MSTTRIEVTTAMLDAAVDAYEAELDGDKGGMIRAVVRRGMYPALEAALNPPAVCKECGKPKDEPEASE